MIKFCKKCQEEKNDKEITLTRTRKQHGLMKCQAMDGL